MRTHRVLVTNDDGIAAPGIQYLARAAVDHGFDVVVAAPTEESSGISAAMTAVVSEGPGRNRAARVGKRSTPFLLSPSAPHPATS
jgi:5'/3'-nucleotidase SurE